MRLRLLLVTGSVTHGARERLPVSASLTIADSRNEAHLYMVREPPGGCADDHEIALPVRNDIGNADLFRSGSGQDLLFLCFELGVGDDSLLLELAQLGQLLRRAGSRPRRLLDVVVEGLLLLSGLGLCTLVHLAPTSDQVDEDPEERQDDHEQDPQHLFSPTQVAAPE